jgi:hypothetical protein
MEILIAIVAVVVIGALIYFNRSSKGLDVNNDGKVDAADAKAAVENVVEGVKAAADVNNDGKVDSADVKVVAEKAKTQAKKTVAKAKTTANKAKSTVKKASTRGRRPKSQA